MKKWVIIFTAALMCIAGRAAAAPAIEVNGKKLDADAVIIDDRTYVPLRGVFEEAGAQVSWNEETQTASVTTAGISDDDMIPAIIEKVSPSIVGIIGRAEIEENYGTTEGIVHGSGIIIKSGGEIMTNAHVVADMKTILVVMNDGKGYEATVKYIDEKSDIAVIKIKKIGLPTATLAAEGNIVVGKRVIAIGTPINFSLRNSATVGYISGVDRGVDSNYRQIQTDATINPGNSGGALVNMQGEVIGITSSGYTGLNTSFAIPIDTVKYVLRQFENYGKVIRAGFGAEFKEDWLAELGVPSESGLTIKSMEKASPLARDFKVGEVLVSINGTAVNSLVELNEILKNYMPGTSVKTGINTGDDIVYTDITLSEDIN